jgi:hypothetical protein
MSMDWIVVLMIPAGFAVFAGTLPWAGLRTRHTGRH